jgi:DNA repair protein RecN (Recombination protein N)
VLVELRVRNLGVIEDLALRLGDGMTALTGETGAGKTLLVEALELLLGGRADPALVRAGEEAAVVEGRFSGEFDDGETELVISREIPAEGRSRAYINGRMATASALAEAGASLVDLHGQHAHQSLLRQGVQRAALDRFAGVTTEEVDAAKATVRALDHRLAEIGGDHRALAREVDLLRFQLDEIDRAAILDADEEDRLLAAERSLGEAEALRMAAEAARVALGGGDDGAPDATDLVGTARSAISGRAPLSDLEVRLEVLAAELADLVAELRTRSEGYEDDPVRLAEVQARRRSLADLKRKYGPSLPDVITFGAEARQRLDDLESADSRREELAIEREAAAAQLEAAERRLGDARREAAPRLAREIEARLHALALPRARIEVSVPDGGSGEDVQFGFGANLGEATLSLAKVASGGELARAMLAIRLILTEAPPTLVFDEVDAGIGGEAALAVGRALAEVGQEHQVLVVTHLAQVAAFASSQVALEKRDLLDRTVTTARTVSGDERLAELSRMLSGQPSSEAARRHAEELLGVAAEMPGGIGEHAPERRA